MATHRPKDPDTPEFVTGGGGIEIPPSERSLSWDNEDFNSFRLLTIVYHPAHL